MSLSYGRLASGDSNPGSPTAVIRLLDAFPLTPRTTSKDPIMPSPVIRAAAFAALLLPAAAHAQTERFTLDGPEVGVYNLVGTLKVEGGTGDKVVVEVTRAGRDAQRLTIQTGDVRGRPALRIRYPEDRIVYPQMGYDSRSNFNVSDDGTFGGDDHGGWGRGGRRVEVRSSGEGLEAHADVRVIVPKGKAVILRHGMGETTIDNVDGRLDVEVAASRVRATHVRGALTLDTGSGGVEVTDMTGDLVLDSGSGGAVLDGVRGGKLDLDIGSGSLRGRAIEVRELSADVGSGGIRLAGVKTPRLHLETGSGGSDVELLGPVEDVQVEAGSGGVTLRLPASLGATVDIETGSGAIDTDFEVKVQRMERHALRGTVGDGRARVRIEAGSGTVRLLKN
jgi:lia operon protein LiaG